MRSTKYTYPEVTWEDLKICPWNWDAFDVGVVLVLECQHSFVEDNSFILFSKHTHEALHKVLWYR